MYYYGYSGGYGYNNGCCPQSYPTYYPQYGYGQGNGYGGAIILVLFILLVIVIGSRFFGNN